MPTIVITGAGKTVEANVMDKADAIRTVSSRLQREYSKDSIEKALNKWLTASMSKPLHIGTGSDTVIIQYRDER
jgi:hypothetical protein